MKIGSVLKRIYNRILGIELDVKAIVDDPDLKRLEYITVELNGTPSRGVLDFNISTNFVIEAELGEVIIAFSEVPPAKTLHSTILIKGKGPIQWPDHINWDNATAPTLGDKWTLVDLVYIDSRWYGNSYRRA